MDLSACLPEALRECHQQMRTGALSLATPAGRWAFGLALVKATQT